MLTGIHFLLTYSCPFECDHCFLYCTPQSEGTFTINQIDEVLDEAVKIGSVKSIYFEGGEPFLYYPLMIESMKRAREKKFSTGAVTNAYWANCDEDARIWLRQIVEIGIDDLSLSDDSYHQGDTGINTARIARKAAGDLGLPAASICIDEPKITYPTTANGKKGEPVIGGGAMFRGRAVDKLTEGLPRRPCHEFKECPHEELVHPKRIHIDSFGNVHICQGISMGNMWETPLSELVANYNSANHPICGPLVEGGPLRLAEKYGLPRDDEFVDHCHFCYTIRKALIDQFPQYLTPRQVYGFK